MTAITRTTSKQVAGFIYEVAQPRRKGNGTVYFIQAGITPFVKIGYCTKGGEKRRLDALQVGNHEKLLLLGVIAGVPTKHESDLHAKFARYWARGEWFRLEGELKAFINRLSV